MTLARIAIRAAMVADLVAGVPAFAGRVYPQRSIPLQPSQLPAAAVYTTGETITPLSGAPVLLRRAARVVVHVIAAGHERIEDTLDMLAGAVETALYGSASLRAVAADWQLAAIEGPDIEADGEMLIGEVRVVWEVLYETDPEQGAPPAVDDFELAYVELETHAARPGPEAVSDVEIEVEP